jgi:pimeloyl-ACP methyl ester carboxylesterase
MGDVAALIRTLGEERAAAVVGHDWGGNVAWHFAMEYPQMLERLAILNMPHPLEMERGLRRPQQIKKSYYIFLYQLPRVPELLVRGGDFAVVRRMWQKDGVPPEDIDRLVEALRVADGVTGPINYYRSAFRSALTMRAKPVRQIDHPVLVIWGERDAYLGKEMAVPNPRWVPHARVEFLPEATHWVQAVSPERVNALLLEFLREGRPYRGRSAASMVG